MKELGLHPADGQVCFGQLLGMCDQISFPLGELGCPGGCVAAGHAMLWGEELIATPMCHVQARQASLCTSMYPTGL